MTALVSYARIWIDASKTSIGSESKRLKDMFERLQREYDQTVATNDELARSAHQAARESQASTSKALHLRTQTDQLSSELQRYQTLAREREEECALLRQQLQQAQERTSDPNEEERESTQKQWDVLKSQLSQQVEQIRTLEASNSKMKGEILVLKGRNTNLEVLKEEKRVLELRVRDADMLRERVGALESELQTLQDDSSMRYVPSLHLYLSKSMNVFLGYRMDMGQTITSR